MKHFPVFLILITSFIIFLFFVDDYYLLKSNLALGADTLTYLDVAESLTIDIADASLIGVSFNFFGPVLLLQVFNYNFLYIYILNCFLFLMSYILIFRTFRLNILTLNWLVWLNPMILFSLLVVNKEIFAFASMSFFLTYTKNRKFLLLIISIFLAILTRWQMVAFILICLLMVSKLNPFRKRRFVSILILIVAASVFYAIQSDVLYEGFERTSETVDFQADRWFGIIPILNSLQANGLYFISVLPKMSFNLFGNPFAFFKIPSLTNPDNYKFFYNDFVISLHQLAISIVVFLTYKKKLLKISVDGIYYSLIYLVIFSLSPIVNTRYIFPIYILIVVELSKIGYFVKNKADLDER